MHDMRNGICPLCDHREIIETLAPQRYGERGELVGSLAVTYAWRKEFLQGEHWITDEPYGKLRLYVCRACGYTQSFATNPADIPIDSKNDTRLVHAGVKPLYR